MRRRIRSVQTTSQITRAMEMVAASKMKRAQSMAIASRPYSDRMGELLNRLAATLVGHNSAAPCPLLEWRERRVVGLTVITARGGLCGSLNSNVIRQAETFILDQNRPVKVLAVGRKGRDWMVRHGHNVIAEFAEVPDRPTLVDTRPISRTLIDRYIRGEIDEVHVVHSQFVSTLIQRPVVRHLLPIEPAESSAPLTEYIFEPDAGEILTRLLPRYVEVQVYQALLEAIASEQSARMVAMRNATDNARKLTNDLSLRLNRARQNSITAEIIEIAAGAEVLVA
mgnify:CR=1 FL=1